jgi:hypothetical protein
MNPKLISFVRFVYLNRFYGTMLINNVTNYGNYVWFDQNELSFHTVYTNLYFHHLKDKWFNWVFVEFTFVTWRPIFYVSSKHLNVQNSKLNKFFSEVENLVCFLMSRFSLSSFHDQSWKWKSNEQNINHLNSVTFC